MNPFTLLIFGGLTFLQPMIDVGLIILPLLKPPHEVVLVEAD